MNYLKKLKECDGQEDFFLTFDSFIKVIRKINFDKINYNNYLSRKKLEQIMNCGLIVNNYLNQDNRIYGFCLTFNPTSKDFIYKYGREYIEFDFEDIKRINNGFLFCHNVCYSLDNSEKYI